MEGEQLWYPFMGEAGRTQDRGGRMPLETATCIRPHLQHRTRTGCSGHPQTYNQEVTKQLYSDSTLRGPAEAAPVDETERERHRERET